MSVSAESLRFILGLKLKSLRQERGVPLRSVAEKAGLSVSYLSEIEKGKKYPKPEKLLRLAEALDVPFDELVSLQVAERLGPLQEVLDSSFVKEFPFEFFGLGAEDVFGLISHTPVRAAALIRTFLDVSKTYDLQVEHFLLAALRSYQQMNANHFEDLEEQATGFRRELGLPAGEPPSAEALRDLLTEGYGYVIDESTIADHPVLRTFRSVFAPSDPPRLLVNGRLLPAQKAFIFAREIGYLRLGLGERAMTSSWIRIESFGQLLNNFKASYFAGAALIDRRTLCSELRQVFSRARWSGAAFLAVVERFRATPEMFFYRLTEIAPRELDLDELFFLRFSSSRGSDKVALTKIFNLSSVPVPHGVGLNEHYCRRWPALGLLAGAAEAGAGAKAPWPLLAAQRSLFKEAQEEFFVLSMARPLSVDESRVSSVSLGFRIDDAFKERVRFWNDPEVPRRVVDLTCERCPLPAEECAERVAPPRLQERARRRAGQEAALAELLVRLAG